MKATLLIDRMKHLDIQQADSMLTTLLDEAIATQTEIVMIRNGIPVARIVPGDIKSHSTQNYPLRGMPIAIAEYFDQPMPELWSALGE